MIRTLIFTFVGFSALVATAQIKPAAPVRDSSRPHAAGVRDSAAPAVAIQPDSIVMAPGGIRLGIDISRFALLFFQPYRTDVVIVGDARLNKSLYAAIETGFSRTSHSDTNYTYKGNGVFATIGIDYNFLKQADPKERHMVYGGIRYGFAQLGYEAPSYTIHSPYWGGNLKGSFPKTNMTAHWAELVLGIRTEVLKNLFLGWSLRERILISSNDNAFQPIVIPGYGSGSKRSQFDMQYSITYCLPLWQVKVRIPRPKAPPKNNNAKK